MRRRWSGHPWQLDSIRWGWEMLPEEEKPQLADAVAILDEAIAGKRRHLRNVDPELDAAIARIADVVGRHRPQT